jgi:hypothetical protein
LAEVIKDSISTLQANLRNVYDDLSFSQKCKNNTKRLGKVEAFDEVPLKALVLTGVGCAGAGLRPI